MEIGLHSYPHHIGDYRRNTAHLSNEEDLAYRRLLEMYYDTEKPIPLETDWVARRLRIGSESVLSVLGEFFTQTQDGWAHKRCDEEITEYRRRAEIARENGRRGGRPKNPVGTQSEPDGIPDATDWKANQEPITNNQEPGTREPKVKAIACPPEVDPQVWSDWVQLRKTKRATVTQTVVAGARKEAEKAGMSLSEFLAVWCRRGSQGMEASWLKATDRQKPIADKYDWLRSGSQVIDME